MRNYFAQSKQLAPLEIMELMGLAQAAAPNAFVDAGRPWYLPAVESEVREYLELTKVDRYRWAEAARKAGGASGGEGEREMVCSSFSILMWALLEQERLRSAAMFPFATARVKLFDHSLCGFINERRQFLLIEPQDDTIYTPRADQELQLVCFQ